MFTQENKHARRMLVNILIVTLLLLAATATPALANGGPTNPNCWGVVTSQRAATVHTIGDHASGQTEPRLGLGNVARAFGFDHVSDLGTFLATLDGIEATQCP